MQGQFVDVVVCCNCCDCGCKCCCYEHFDVGPNVVRHTKKGLCSKSQKIYKVAQSEESSGCCSCGSKIKITTMDSGKNFVWTRVKNSPAVMAALNGLALQPSPAGVQMMT